MKPNRSIPSSTVIPVLIYPDVREAVGWLDAAFGFAERVRIGENHRSQLSFGGGAVIIGDVRHERRPPRPGEATHGVMVRVDDAHAHCERARKHGARIVMEPTDFEYGERQYTAEDHAGHQWTFSETFADVAPEEWGGTSVGGGVDAKPTAPDVTPIGRVESPLADVSMAPKQGDEGAPEAWLVFEPAVLDALDGIQAGNQLIVLTWLDRARRDLLRGHPRGDPSRPERGVFGTRSPHRPNPIGLHQVDVVSIEGGRVRVRNLEALDGTPILDVKGVLASDIGER